MHNNQYVSQCGRLLYDHIVNIIVIKQDLYIILEVVHERKNISHINEIKIKSICIHSDKAIFILSNDFIDLTYT